MFSFNLGCHLKHWFFSFWVGIYKIAPGLLLVTVEKEDLYYILLGGKASDSHEAKFPEELHRSGIYSFQVKKIDNWRLEQTYTCNAKLLKYDWLFKLQLRCQLEELTMAGVSVVLV